jgi:hypothetical protein
MLARHLDDFVSAYNYNFGRPLKQLRGLTLRVHLQSPASEPERFTLNLLHHMPGLNT